MSRKTNKLKSRLRSGELHARRLAALAAKLQAKADAAEGRAVHAEAMLSKESALTIRVGAPDPLIRYGKHFRIDFVIDAFEWDYRLRQARFNFSVSDYAGMVASEAHDKLLRLLIDQLSGRGITP